MSWYAVTEELNRLLAAGVIECSGASAWCLGLLICNDLNGLLQATPHAMTGAMPFELLYGWQMHTRLTVLLPSSSAMQIDTAMRHKVSHHQQRMKTSTDHKWCPGSSVLRRQRVGHKSFACS
ncbi:hypothetical protein AOLI_G00156340 [Acnodon oligacanthus]